MSSTEDSSAASQEPSYGEAPVPLSPRVEEEPSSISQQPQQHPAPRILLPLHERRRKALSSHKARSSESSLTSDSSTRSAISPISPQSSNLGLPPQLHSRSSSISDALYRDQASADGLLSPRTVSTLHQRANSSSRPVSRHFAPIKAASSAPASVTRKASTSHLSSHTAWSSTMRDTEKYGLHFGPSDPNYWLAEPGVPEADDWLHDPDVEEGGKEGLLSSNGSVLSRRSVVNLGTLIFLILGLVGLFGCYPIVYSVLKHQESSKGGFNLGGVNASGQMFSGMRGLIDPDTPAEVMERMTADGKTKMKLVFSDEFETPGRSFYPGDDPFWTAADLHYWGTRDFEWYDPAAITTANGSLVISIEEMPNHNLNFRAGMLQSWNQFCFVGGILEARVLLPGAGMLVRASRDPSASRLETDARLTFYLHRGNLGRAGYGGSNHGTWPYTYDTCDVGTLPNQTYSPAQGGGPILAQTSGDNGFDGALSFLPGQRLSRCTCEDSDDHPGPKHADGTWVGRSAPELDLLEAAAGSKDGDKATVSMSLQLAPFNAGYNLTKGDDAITHYSSRVKLNGYRGSVNQQAASSKMQLPHNAWEDSNPTPDDKSTWSTYSVEYKPGTSLESHVTWMLNDELVWRLGPDALAPDPRVEIDRRHFPEEPMYIIVNLGLSSAFTTVDFNALSFPKQMHVDYIRVWQPEDAIDVGCDPAHHPTSAYIKKHWELYTNANITTFTEPRKKGGYAHKFPGNRLKGECR